ncbi:MAG: TspO/MBR family protein [Acidobacteriota bacterium]
MKIKPILVILGTIGVIAMNIIASMCYIGGITPNVISDKTPTFLTPAGYAFAIWGWIYLGLIIFSVYQALPSKLEKFDKMRTLYLISCLLNCLWLYFWHQEQITISLFVILTLLASLAFINLSLERENNLLARFVFGIYFGWVTVASVVNTTIALVYLGVKTTDETGIWLASGLIVVATGIGIFLRHKLPNIAYPLAIAWAITAIAVKQSGKTPIVFIAGVCVIALLISALSFVVTAENRPPR